MTIKQHRPVARHRKPVSWTIGAFTAIFLAVAGPGVPRGAFLMPAPMLQAIGLPVEGIGILIAVDAIPDLFSTVLNETGDHAAAAIVARQTG